MSCVTAAGYQSAQSIRMQAVTIVTALKSAQYLALAVDNANNMLDNYRKQYELSKRAMEISEAMQGQQSVFWGAENQFRNEFSNPEPIEDVEVMGRRYSGRLISTILGAFAKKIREAKCGMNRYCTSANMKALQDIYLMRAFAVGQARTLGRNIAFAEWQARNDLNWKRRQQAAALGRKLTGDAAGLIAAAGKGLAGVGDSYAKGFSSALEGLGYTLNRAAGYSDQNVMANAATYEANQDPYGGGYQYDTGNELFGGNSYQSNGGQPMYGPSALPVQGINDIGGTGTMSLAGEVTSGVPDDFWNPQSASNPAIDDASVYNEPQNPTDVGAVDRVRVGTYAFPVQGGSGFVNIDMSKFPVGYADHLDTGGQVATVPGGGAPTWPN